MDRARVFLRTNLFTLRSHGHVPRGTFVLEGVVREYRSGGLLVAVDRYLNDSGDAMEGSPLVLFLPSGKIDHVIILEEKA